MSNNDDFTGWHGTTIIAVRKDGKVVVAGDGQVTAGATVMKHTAKKVRRLAGGKVIGGFAGATADAFTLLERAVPFVFLTGYDTRSIIPAPLASAPVLSKPIDEQKLVATVVAKFQPNAD